jgi:hypothetical protein
MSMETRAAFSRHASLLRLAGTLLLLLTISWVPAALAVESDNTNCLYGVLPDGSCAPYGIQATHGVGEWPGWAGGMQGVPLSSGGVSGDAFQSNPGQVAVGGLNTNSTCSKQNPAVGNPILLSTGNKVETGDILNSDNEAIRHGCGCD